ncbi:MAG: hypothetical protein V1800_14090 [Candidatus Latescibacterota bacterium]
MRRQMLVSGALAIVIALIMAVGSIAQAEMEQYESQVLLDLSWGDGPSDMGYAKEGPEDGEGLRCGPAAFDVDKDGTIYIMDTVHHLVKVFARTGKLLRSFPVEMQWDGSICLDEEGNVWLNDGNRYAVRKYAPDGAPIQSIEYGPGPDRAVELGITVRGGEVYLGVSKVEVGEETMVAGKRGERMYEATRRPLNREEKPRFIGRTSKRRYKEIPDSGDRITYVVEHVHGNSKRISFDVKGYRDVVIFQSEDGYGNVYFYVSLYQGYRGKGEDRVRYIYKYNSDMDLLAKAGPLLTGNYTEREKFLVIDDAGNIYHLATSKAGVKVVKWSPLSE